MRECGYRLEVYDDEREEWVGRPEVYASATQAHDAGARLSALASEGDPGNPLRWRVIEVFYRTAEGGHG